MPDDAEIGRIVREKNEATRELNALLLKARELGDKFRLLGDYLLGHPEQIKFEGVGFDVNYAPLAGPASFKIVEINGKEVSDLVTSIRDAMEKLKRLNSRAAQLGL